MKEWILDILKIVSKKLWEYVLMLFALLAIYMLTIGGCWKQVSKKFGFVEELTKEIDLNKIEVPDGFEIKRKSD